MSEIARVHVKHIESAVRVWQRFDRFIPSYLFLYSFSIILIFFFYLNLFEFNLFDCVSSYFPFQFPTVIRFILQYKKKKEITEIK